jgi:hypothetical protein
MFEWTASINLAALLFFTHKRTRAKLAERKLVAHPIDGVVGFLYPPTYLVPPCQSKQRLQVAWV